MMNKHVTLKNGTKGKIIAQLTTGEYVLRNNERKLIKFTKQDIKENIK